MASFCQYLALNRSKSNPASKHKFSYLKWPIILGCGGARSASTILNDFGSNLRIDFLFFFQHRFCIDFRAFSLIFGTPDICRITFSLQTCRKNRGFAGLKIDWCSCIFTSFLASFLDSICNIFHGFAELFRRPLPEGLFRGEMRRCMLKNVILGGGKMAKLKIYAFCFSWCDLFFLLACVCVCVCVCACVVSSRSGESDWRPMKGSCCVSRERPPHL